MTYAASGDLMNRIDDVIRQLEPRPHFRVDFAANPETLWIIPARTCSGVGIIKSPLPQLLPVIDLRQVIRQTG